MNRSIQRERAKLPCTLGDIGREIVHLHICMKECAKAFLLTVEIGEEAGLDHLRAVANAIPDYPWKRANLETLDHIVRAIRNGDGFWRHQREFFAEAP